MKVLELQCHGGENNDVRGSMVLASLLTRGSECEIRSAVVRGGGRTEEGLHSAERGRRAGQVRNFPL